MNKRDILIFAPTYNERGNISDLCQMVLGIVPDSDFLVIDDNSNDGTRIILDQLMQKNSHLKVIYRPSKMGIGSAHRLAILLQLEKDIKF